MENFIDHMIFVCFSGAFICFVLGGWVAIGEFIMKKFNLEDKFLNFMYGDGDNE